MIVNIYKVKAYAVLVRAKKYILDESDRENPDQILVPQDYIIAVSEYLVN